ncbi:hypothetical protein BGZ65_005975, partial [Modicella reniformis]
MDEKPQGPSDQASPVRGRNAPSSNGPNGCNGNDGGRNDDDVGVNSPRCLSVDDSVDVGDDHHQHPPQLQGPSLKRRTTVMDESEFDLAMSTDTRNDSQPSNQELQAEHHESQTRGRKRGRRARSPAPSPERSQKRPLVSVPRVLTNDPQSLSVYSRTVRRPYLAPNVDKAGFTPKQNIRDTQRSSLKCAGSGVAMPYSQQPPPVPLGGILSRDHQA